MPHIHNIDKEHDSQSFYLHLSLQPLEAVEWRPPQILALVHASPYPPVAHVGRGSWFRQGLKHKTTLSPPCESSI